ncbi:MAG: hypothetical protein LCH63_10975 [Candidatus Melainabacteria bacterium]|jgi:hypothetical protein|nr:hypothetical protein [Candidatus Melainabacteria bacterium]
MQELDDPFQESAASQSAGQVLKQLLDFVLASFNSFDLNQDGFLTRFEIERALQAPERTIKEAAFLQFILVRMNEIAETVQDDSEVLNGEIGISIDDLKTYFAALPG